ncbi:MAG: nucleotidyltransferase [Phycisphaerae bacterium]|nr:nucleotidyltransferase [Phycisphaerae bacterium]
MMWCEAQFAKFDEKLRLDQGRRDRIQSALGAFNDFCQRDEQLRAALAEPPFLQGSVPMLCAIKPLGKDEYDVDVVYPFRLAAWKEPRPGPGTLVKWFTSRLKENEFYSGRMEIKNRCVRIHYKGDFHVDLIPSAVDVDAHKPYAVPAKDLSDWITNDPRGFVDWFLQRDKASGMADSDGCGVLIRSVRIMKRWRDQFFGSDARPTSILLTTILAKHEASAKTYSPPLPDPYYPKYPTTAAYLYDLIRLTVGCIKDASRTAFEHPTIRGEDLRRNWDDSFAKAFVERLDASARSLLAGIQSGTDAAATPHYLHAFGETFPRG